MKLFASLLAATCFADFRIKLQLCSDVDRPTNIVKAAFGGTKALSVQLDDEPEQSIDLPYDDSTLQLQTHETVMAGSLEATSMVQFRYYVQDILCIEKLELESMDKSMHFKIIQDYDPFAWDVTTESQSWTSLTNAKISYWSVSCVTNDRTLSKTAPFQQSCHDIVSFLIITVDECSTGAHGCGSEAICTDLATAYECSCPVGYEGNGLETSSNSVGCVRPTTTSTTTSTTTKTTSPTTTTTTTTTPTTTSTTSTTTTFTTPDNTVSEIFSLIIHAFPSMAGKFSNYGCAGHGNMDASVKTVSRPIDAVDKALNIRKHCINCATKEFGSYTTYTYDTQNNICNDSVGRGSRAFCECDLQFVTAVDGLPAKNKNINKSRCVAFANGSTGSCCPSLSGGFTWFNTQKSVCCSGRVVSIGSC